MRICLGKDKYEPIPDGFARVLIIGEKVEGLRMAREEIQHLLELSMDINPNVPRWKVDENGQVKERIKVPRRDKLNEEQKARMTQIMKEAVSCSLEVKKYKFVRAKKASFSPKPARLSPTDATLCWRARLPV